MNLKKITKWQVLYALVSAIVLWFIGSTLITLATMFQGISLFLKIIVQEGEISKEFILILAMGVFYCFIQITSLIVRWIHFGIEGLRSREEFSQENMGKIEDRIIEMEEGKAKLYTTTEIREILFGKKK